MVEIHEFFVEGGDQERSHVLLHITEPSTKEEMPKGYFFALTEINNGTTEQIEYLQSMIDELEASYYNTLDSPDKNAFEICLEKINKRGHRILENKNSVVSCIVGVVKKNQLAFAYHGHPTSKLFYNRNNKIEVVDILASDDEDYTVGQLFSAVMEGNINSGDNFYVCTPHAADHTTDDEVIKALTGRTTENVADYFQKVLSGLRSNLSFGGIFCHIPKKTIQTKENSIVDKKIENDNPSKSKNKVAVKNLLKIRKAKKNALARVPKRSNVETNYRPRDSRQNGSFFTVMLITLGRAIVTGALGLYKISKKIILLVVRLFVNLVLIITNKGGQRTLVVQSMNDWTLRKKQYFTQLPLLSKILFFSSVVLAIIFVGSIGILRIKERRQVANLAYENQILSITDKKNAAEASMIYDDESKAFELLQEAALAVDELPTDSKQKRQRQIELATQIDTSLLALRKINTVQPELIVDLSSQEESTQVSRLAAIDDLLVAFGPNDSFNYIIDPDTKKVSKKEHSNISGLFAASTPKEQDNILFLGQNNIIAEYQKDSKTLSSKKIDLAGGAKLADVFVYNQKVYSLDSTSNQIIKHSKTQTGYDRGIEWIKGDQNVNLSDGVSIAVDGDVFVLKTDGQIFRLAKGILKDFQISGLDPKLEKPTELWTYNDVKNLYILEPANKRIVVLNKDGKLLQQYTADEWAGPTGMVVDEAADVVYVVDSNKIYKFSLQ